MSCIGCGANLIDRAFGFVSTSPSAEAQHVLDLILDQIDQLWLQSVDLDDAIQKAAYVARNSPILVSGRHN